MLPRNHPQPKGPVRTGGSTRTPGSTWSPTSYPLFDGTLEGWLIDQLAVSTMQMDLKLLSFEHLGTILRALRREAAACEVECLARTHIGRICDRSTPAFAAQLMSWQLHEANGTFSIWRMGKGGFAIQFEEENDGSYRWCAGHNFQPVASCSAHVPGKGKEPGRTCGKIAALVAPLCQTHTGAEYRSNLAAEGLIASASQPSSQEISSGA